MDKLMEALDAILGFCVKEFIWFFLSLFFAILLTLMSLWLINDFAEPLSHRIKWEGIEEKSEYLIWIAGWWLIINLIRLVRGALVFLILPSEEGEEGEEDDA